MLIFGNLRFTMYNCGTSFGLGLLVVFLINLLKEMPQPALQTGRELETMRHARRRARVSASARVFSLLHRSNSFAIYNSSVCYAGQKFHGKNNRISGLINPRRRVLGRNKPYVHSNITEKLHVPISFAHPPSLHQLFRYRKRHS